MAYFFVFLTILFWGIGTYLGKAALHGVSPLYVYLFEALGTLTVACLTSLFFRRELLGAIARFSWAGYLFGILWGIGTVTFVIALKYKPAGVVVSLTGLYPLVTVVLAVLFLGETITMKTGIGMSLAILGGLLLF